MNNYFCDAFSLFTSAQTTIPLSKSVCLRSCPAMLDSCSSLIYKPRMNRTLLASKSVVLMTTLAMTSSPAHRKGVTAGGAWRSGMWVQKRKLGNSAIPSTCSLDMCLKFIYFPNNGLLIIFSTSLFCLMVVQLLQWSSARSYITLSRKHQVCFLTNMYHRCSSLLNIVYTLYQLYCSQMLIVDGVFNFLYWNEASSAWLLKFVLIKCLEWLNL